jgi:hypothetical protein
MAVSMFALPGKLRIVDTVYEYADGKDVQRVTGERMIEAAVDKSGGKRLEAIFGGSATGGAIMITTTEPLYFTDAYAPGEPSKQSFVMYDGINYRIAGIDSWKDQLGVNVYLANRHITQDVI